MPFKNVIIHYVVNSVLMSMRLMPITPKNNIHFISSNGYSRKVLGTANVFTDIVIKKKSIEMHEYSPDPREAYTYSSYDTTEDFLRVLIKQRIEWHITFQVKSSAIKKLHAKSDYQTLAAAAQQLQKDQNRIREANISRLEKQLDSRFVKVASLLIGF
jgi:hypothetical protein